LKTTYLLALMIGCVILTSGVAYAGAPSPGSQQKLSEGAANTSGDPAHVTEYAAPVGDGEHVNDTEPPQEQPGHRLSEAGNPRSPSALLKANRPKPLSYTRERLSTEAAKNLHQPGLGKPGEGARGTYSRNETVHTTRTIQPPSDSPPAMRSHSTARVPSTSPVVIGGRVNSDGRTTGAINGTRMIRRP
jgi:hypothetical protein